jgi:outer membrane protein
MGMRGKGSVVALAAVLSAMASPALADEGQGRTAPRGERDGLTLGVAGIIAPGYEGSDRYRARPFPVIDYNHGRFFAGARGVGYRVVEAGPVSAAVALTYMPGYKSSDVPAGVGGMGAGLGLRGSVSARLDGVVASASLTKALVGAGEGMLGEASFARPVRAGRALLVVPSFRLRWADTDYNNRYFGVNATQAAASHLPAYHAGGGLRDASASLMLQQQLDAHWSLGAMAGVSTLLGDARHSPLVRQATAPMGMLSLSYHFGGKRR